MTNQQILEKAIQKAIDGGLKAPGELDEIRDKTLNIWFKTGSGKAPVGVQYPTLIFSHDFANALWGDEFIYPEMSDDKGYKITPFLQTAWRYHQRQMLMDEDPIKYLGEHLDG